MPPSSVKASENNCASGTTNSNSRNMIAGASRQAVSTRCRDITLTGPSAGSSLRRTSASFPVRVNSQATLANLAADDDPLDFGGAFPDAVHANVAIKALHRILAHIAAAAQNLQRLVDHA